MQESHYWSDPPLNPDFVSKARQEYFVFWFYNTGKFRTSKERYRDSFVVEVTRKTALEVFAKKMVRI